MEAAISLCKEDKTRYEITLNSILNMNVENFKIKSENLENERREFIVKKINSAPNIQVSEAISTFVQSKIELEMINLEYFKLLNFFEYYIERKINKNLKENINFDIKHITEDFIKSIGISPDIFKKLFYYEQSGDNLIINPRNIVAFIEDDEQISEDFALKLSYQATIKAFDL